MVAFRSAKGRGPGNALSRSERRPYEHEAQASDSTRRIERSVGLGSRDSLNPRLQITRLRFVLVLQSSALARVCVIAGCSFVRALPMVAFRSAKVRGPGNALSRSERRPYEHEAQASDSTPANRASDSTRQIERVVPPPANQASDSTRQIGLMIPHANRAIGYSGSMPKSRIVSSVSNFNPRSANLASPPARRSMIPRTPSTFKPKASAASTACNALPPLVITSSTI
ncbi:hypothetical protein Mal33_20510 [Rosistilla oblonga]|uniref:Uncharacterized protein n=1 Tax=Rosistilla oblonga TaxID=2527990 RepID=A0A518ISK5_9BACT|nr:hypothetical protein Mal33_20510 [Rosistilla oblonga]